MMQSKPQKVSEEFVKEYLMLKKEAEPINNFANGSSHSSNSASSSSNSDNLPRMPLTITASQAVDKFLGILPLSNATHEKCKSVAQHYGFKSFKASLKWDNVFVCNQTANQPLPISLYGGKISKASIYYNDSGSIYKYNLEIGLPTQSYTKTQAVAIFNKIKSNLVSSGFSFKNNKMGPRDIYSLVSSGRSRTTEIGLERFNEKVYKIYISVIY